MLLEQLIIADEINSILHVELMNLFQCQMKSIWKFMIGGSNIKIENWFHNMSANVKQSIAAIWFQLLIQ